jgi:hypothetical protein
VEGVIHNEQKELEKGVGGRTTRIKADKGISADRRHGCWGSENDTLKCGALTHWALWTNRQSQNWSLSDLLLPLSLSYLYEGQIPSKINWKAERLELTTGHIQSPDELYSRRLSVPGAHLSPLKIIYFSGWGCRSIIEHLPSMHEGLGSSPRVPVTTIKEKKSACSLL